MNIGGLGVAMITPFDKGGEIDFEAIPRIVNHIVEGGADYLVVMGTTGESATLTEKEKQAVVEKIVAVANRRIPLVIGIGGNDTKSVTSVLKKADLQHFDAILSVSPYYNKPSQEGIYRHYEQLSNESPLPVILYNVPPRTGSNVLPETVLRLASGFENIVGIKESGGNLLQAQQIIKDAPEGFQVVSGDDAFALPLIFSGAVGVISVLGNATPRPITQMINRAVSNRVKDAYAIHYQLLDLMQLLFEEGNPTGIKTLMETMFLCNRTVRLPLVEATSSLTDRLKTALSETKIQLY